MGKPKQATARYRRSKGKGRALQLQAARLKRNIHQLVENASEVVNESFDLEQVQQQSFDEGQHTKRLGSARDSVRKANCRRSQQHRREKVRRATQEERRRQEQAEGMSSFASDVSMDRVPQRTERRRVRFSKDVQEILFEMEPQFDRVPRCGLSYPEGMSKQHFEKTNRPLETDDKATRSKPCRLTLQQRKKRFLPFLRNVEESDADTREYWQLFCELKAIRASRKHRGCGCEGECQPDTCLCLHYGIFCQSSKVRGYKGRGCKCRCVKRKCDNINPRYLVGREKRIKAHYEDVFSRLHNVKGDYFPQEDVDSVDSKVRN
ncbi:hypothetical protein ACOMHN_059855 [Nucella lapillus]